MNIFYCNRDNTHSVITNSPLLEVKCKMCDKPMENIGWYEDDKLINKGDEE